MTVPAVSQHLRKMRDADIVQTRKDGQTIFYALKEDHLSIIEPLFHHIDHSKDALV
jgi:DNA-binding transcriptional ArsR family regulator